ncbi:MAG: DsrE family protein [Ferruginibacter sp.]
MNRFFVMIALLSFVVLPAFGQPNNDPTAKPAAPEMIYLPAAILDDPAALAKAIPGYAIQVMAGLPKKGTMYYKQAATYYLLAGDYRNAADAIDSVRKAEDNPSWRILYKTYVDAKMKDNTEGAIFKQVFQKEYSAAFNKLSFDQKVNEADIDSVYINELNSGYKNAIEDMKKNKSDSVSLTDAKDFFTYYRDYIIYNKLLPLTMPYTTDPKYKKSFPAIKGNNWGGVFPVEGIDEIPDPKQQYKLLMELTSFGMKEQPDSIASKDINLALRDISRTINLHVGAGISKEKIDVVLAVHAKALHVFLNNEKYKKKYGVDNPNLPLIKELQDFGVKITLCGQAMHFLGLPREQFIPGVKVSLTAQTVISSYQLKGYVFSDLTLHD